jgi:phosphoribosylformimino-5-aminoimidazole carboxamide ribotide isomerase
MIIFPAIDLKEGKCVRLFKGDMNQATIFNHDPVNQAREFENLGFKYIHIVDLDGATQGKSVNHEFVKNIIKNVKVPVQLGGGIRSISAIENWLELGVSRVILGTAAAKNPDLVKEAGKKFGDKIIIGIDAKNGFVSSEGWVDDSKIEAIELAKKYQDCSVGGVIYTEISRDGTLIGVDLEYTKKIAAAISIPVIASGGVGSIDDVIKVKELESFGVVGLIIGRAIYEKKVSIADLLKI